MMKLNTLIKEKIKRMVPLPNNKPAYSEDRVGKKISSGVYEYNGYRIERGECRRTGAYNFGKQQCQTFDKVWRIPKLTGDRAYQNKYEAYYQIDLELWKQKYETKTTD